MGETTQQWVECRSRSVDTWTPPEPAHHSRCAEAPYSVAPEKYPQLIDAVTRIFNRPNIELIAGICKQRFEGADRGILYSLGFTDQQIDDTPTDQLTTQVVRALRDALRNPR